LLALGFFDGMKNIFLIRLKKLLIAAVIIYSVSQQGYLSIFGNTYEENQSVTADYRVLKLNNLLKKYDSPLVPYASYFINEADIHKIDWKLIPAITGVESSFGIYIPMNSFNAYGWNGGNTKFSDWITSISIVTKSLAKNYIAKGAITVDQIAPIYNPVTPGAWSTHVKYFMNELEKTPPFINEVLNLPVEI
jgi:hypothetical protein